jgi:hypothetical protein
MLFLGLFNSKYRGIAVIVTPLGPPDYAYPRRNLGADVNSLFPYIVRKEQTQSPDLLHLPKMMKI